MSDDSVWNAYSSKRHKTVFISRFSTLSTHSVLRRSWPDDRKDIQTTPILKSSLLWSWITWNNCREIDKLTKTENSAWYVSRLELRKNDDEI